MPNNPKLTHPAAIATQRWVHWAFFVLFFLFLIGSLLMNNGHLDTYLFRATRWYFGDQNTYRWNAYRLPADTPGAPWYRTDPPPEDGLMFEKTRLFWIYMRQMGETWVTVFLAILVAFYNRRGWKAAALVAMVTSLTGLASTLIRITAGRMRPMGSLTELVRNDADNIWILFRGFYTTKDLSFPSGHATLAFGLAAVMSYLSPQTRWFWIGWATLCAISRVVQQAHYYADVSAGAAIGWGLGMFVCYLGDQWLEKLPDWPWTKNRETPAPLRNLFQEKNC